MWITAPEALAMGQASDREELARRATALAREATGNADIEILWHEGWIRRAGDLFVPDPDLFQVAEPNWTRWLDQEAKHLRDAADYWFHVYKPLPGDV
ncbi:MAG: hypothetical protein NTY38_26040, partial [Acidobacteria bacterium]|nr:hypothetical protein [Acidobacteriota bacterium]